MSTIEFVLERLEDESGVSGIGEVAIGAQFPSGRVVLEWLVPPHSMGIYQNMEEVEKIHGHNGKTKIVLRNKFYG
jgi:hypothetical protein